MEKIGAFTDRTTDTGEWRPGNPATGQTATPMLSEYFNMLQRELVNVVESGGEALDRTDDGQMLAALRAMGVGTGQFQDWIALRTYRTGEVVRGSDGHFYEFYDRDLAGIVSGVDPVDSSSRPRVWMRWDGVRPGSVIEWRSVNVPEGYIENNGSTISRSAYRRIFDAVGTVYGAGDGSTTFQLPDDRGEFKRGLDQGRGRDPRRSLGAHQSDSIRNHEHGMPTSSGRIMARDGVGEWVIADGDYSKAEAKNDQPVNNETATTGGVKGGWDHETRPYNVAVIYLTKI